MGGVKINLIYVPAENLGDGAKGKLKGKLLVNCTLQVLGY